MHINIYNVSYKHKKYDTTNISKYNKKYKYNIINANKYNIMNTYIHVS